MGGGRTGFGPVKRRRATLLLYLSVLRATFYRVGRNDRENTEHIVWKLWKRGGGIVLFRVITCFFSFSLSLSRPREIFFHCSRWNRYFIFNSISLLFDKLETRDNSKSFRNSRNWNIQFHLLRERVGKRKEKRTEMLISVAMNYIFLLQLELLNRKASTRDYFGRSNSACKFGRRNSER